MKLFMLSAVIGLTCMSHSAMAGEGPDAGDDCYDDVEAAKSACIDATLKAGQLNNLIAVRQAAAVNPTSTGANQTGSYLSDANSDAAQNGSWAKGECERARTTMRDKCSDAAKRLADKRKGDVAAGDKQAVAMDDRNHTTGATANGIATTAGAQ